MGQKFGRLCKGIVNLDEIKFSHERLVQQQDLHVQDLQLSVQYLHGCIVVIAAITAVIILSLAILVFYLSGVRDEQRRRMETMRYEGAIQDLKNRIKEMETEKATSQDAHQQHFVYAMPGLPHAQHLK